MNDFHLSPDDPRLTAYALGELVGEEHAQVEAALTQNPALRTVVDEIRGTAAQLEEALATEPLPAVGPLTDEFRRGHAEQHRRKLLRFPAAYYLVSGLAAAGFAVLVVLHGPAPTGPVTETPVLGSASATGAASPKREYVSVDLAPAAASGESGVVAEAADDVPPAIVFRMPPPIAVAADASSTRAATLAEATTTASAAAPPPLHQEHLQTERVFSLAPPEQAAEVQPAPALVRVQKAATASPGAAGRAAPAATASAQPAVVTASAPPQVVTTDSFEGGEVVHLQQFVVQSEREGNAAAITDATQHFSGTLRGMFSRDSRAQPQHTTEAYGYRRDNTFIAVANEPLSTFAIDVDTASYANVRRFLQQGRLPPRDAVRVEELVNYFPYRYQPPTNSEPFAASLEVAAAPWEPKHRLVRIGLKGREVSQAARPAANLVFLLDVSGSMNEPNKLPLVKESMRLLVGKLRADDRVAIVTYAGNSGLALPSTEVSRSREILDAIEQLAAGGSTNGAMGIQLAYDIAKANFVTEGVNRVILCTDGDFNVGVTSQGELVRLVQEKAKSGVFLTVLGFGMGNIKDDTLEQLANRGNGVYGYIDSRREAEKLLVEQANGTLVTIAKDVKIQVEFNPAQVSAYRLIGYENRLLRNEDFNNDKVDAGEIGAGHTVTALYEIVPAGGEVPAEAGTVDELKYQPVRRADARPTAAEKERAAAANAELLTVKIRYKRPAGILSRKLEFPLTDGGAEFAAASADFRFAAAVAGFGLTLRAEPPQSVRLAEVATWAEGGIEDDPNGYRSEFVRLVRTAESLAR